MKKPILTLAAMLTLASAQAPRAATYYVDSRGGLDANPGTSADKPWQTLEQAGKAALQPGDRLLFRAGREWKGTLTVKAQGSKKQPVVIGKYGDGALPRIDGGGAQAAMFLENPVHVTVEDIEITNPGPQDGKTLRSGIYLVWTPNWEWTPPAAAEGEKPPKPGHITLRRLFVHDVHGVVTRPTKPTFYQNGGIWMRNSSRYEQEGWRVEQCRIVDIHGVGCWMEGGKKTRGVALRTRMEFKNNELRRTGGDGLIITYGLDAHVSGNRCYDLGAHGKPGAQGTVVIAGIWTGWHTHNSLFEYNEVARTRHFENDGHAFDVDNDCSGTHVFQYNYTHDNEGGVLMAMPSNRGNIVYRYNVSVNDRHRGAQREAFGVRGSGNLHIYNNTFVKFDGAPFTVANNNKITVNNNIFYTKVNTAHPGGATFGNNCFFGPQTVNDAGKLVADPLFVNLCPPKDGMEHADNYRLKPDSPCRDAGIEIKDNGGHDFWENPLYNGQPDIGAHEIQGKKPDSL
jgi:hypothetical protein